MKTMSCLDLGGACSKEFSAETFEEIAILAKHHGSEMAEKGDEVHLKAMDEMRKLMSKPGEVEKWMIAKKQKFDSLEDA